MYRAPPGCFRARIELSGRVIYKEDAGSLILVPIAHLEHHDQVSGKVYCYMQVRSLIE